MKQLKDIGILSGAVSSVIAIAVFVMVLPQTLCAALKSELALTPFGNDRPNELFERGRRYLDNEKLDSAIICFSWLVETYRDTNDRDTRNLVGRSLSEMGQLYYVRYTDYAGAFRFFTEAEKIFVQDNDKKAYSTVLLNLGNLFNMYDYIFPQNNGANMERSRKYYKKAMDLGVETEDWDMVCSAYINMSMLDLPFRVNKEINNRMSILLKDSIPPSVADYALSSQLCYGSEALANKDYAVAKKAMMTLRDSVGLTAPREKYMANVCLSSVSLATKNYPEAIECLEGVFHDNSGINDIDVHMEVYDFLSRFHGLAGNKDLSQFYRIKFYETRDSLTSKIIAIEPTRIGMELENVRENARHIDAERHKIKLWLIFVGLIVLVLAGVAIVVYRKNRLLNLKNIVIFNQMQSLMQETSKTDGQSAITNEPLIGEEQETCDVDCVSQPEKYRDSSMTYETRQNLIVKIEEVLGDINEICDKNFSLQRLTSLVGSNTSYISRIVNEHYGISFGNLLNRCRVQEACRRMGDMENYGNLTIEAISESVGFNTRSTFTKAFRLHIGMLPSEYIRLLKKNNDSSTVSV